MEHVHVAAVVRRLWRRSKPNAGARRRCGPLKCRATCMIRFPAEPGQPQHTMRNYCNLDGERITLGGLVRPWKEGMDQGDPTRNGGRRNGMDKWNGTRPDLDSTSCGSIPATAPARRASPPATGARWRISSTTAGSASVVVSLQHVRRRRRQQRRRRTILAAAGLGQVGARRDHRVLGGRWARDLLGHVAPAAHRAQGPGPGRPEGCDRRLRDRPGPSSGRWRRRLPTRPPTSGSTRADSTLGGGETRVAGRRS